MRVFVQYLSSGEHERFIASIERERELRFRLSELLRYRSLGLTTQDEVIHYEQHSSFERQQQLKLKTVSNMVCSSHLLHTHSIFQKEYVYYEVNKCINLFFKYLLWTMYFIFLIAFCLN